MVIGFTKPKVIVGDLVGTRLIFYFVVWFWGVGVGMKLLNKSQLVGKRD